MIKFLFTLLFFSALTAITVGQHDENIDYGQDILKQAENSFCKGDTNQTIKNLESYSNKFPERGTTILISKIISDFYLTKGNTELAINLLTRILDLQPTTGYFIYKDKCGLYSGLDPSSIKADICVTLSKAYFLLDDNSTALEYLKLADTKYLPSFGGCANGMIMYKTKLSLDFADYYLLTGDTLKAIDRLIEFFLSNERYDDMVTAKLKSILLLKYSQKEITAEINSGIETMRIVKGQVGEPHKTLIITFSWTDNKEICIQRLEIS